jgi:DinB superfamily
MKEDLKMEVKEFIRLELDNAKRGISRALDGLTRQEITWRPCSGCNSIGLIVYHLARFEDSLIQNRLQGKPQIWETDKWYQKMSLPMEDVGAHYTIDLVNAFVVPELADIINYADAVREKTLDYLKNMQSDELSRQITMLRGPMPVSGVLVILIGHAFQHMGEISYLRGMQRGMDK